MVSSVIALDLGERNLVTMALLSKTQSVVLLKQWPGGMEVRALRQWLQTGYSWKPTNEALLARLSSISSEITKFAVLYKSQVVVERFGPFPTGFTHIGVLDSGGRGSQGDFTRIYPLMPFPTFLEELDVRLRQNDLPVTHRFDPAGAASQICGRCFQRGRRVAAWFSCMSNRCGWEADADTNAAWVLGRRGWALVTTRYQLLATIAQVGNRETIPQQPEVFA